MPKRRAPGEGSIYRDDKRGTTEYRIKVAGVLAKRTVQQALERARNG